MTSRSQLLVTTSAETCLQATSTNGSFLTKKGDLRAKEVNYTHNQIVLLLSHISAYMLVIWLGEIPLWISFFA